MVVIDRWMRVSILSIVRSCNSELFVLIQLLIWQFGFFFFKQKTAYEMQRGLVGSEMCIRDSLNTVDLHVSSEKDSSIVGLKTEKLNSRPIHLSFNDTQEQKNDHISLLLLNRPEKKYILKFPNKEN
eukprot:TRINITY_DN31882_c0_g1_i1.p1 TRINITY_DN31882_c0_g1~~TRINITY_DN31882_c0_g1_i1.p1  ORF type:complete len:127 (-),score=14.89 TRINITY_DN31882_c0_g1_i1:99-479(-)